MKCIEPDFLGESGSKIYKKRGGVVSRLVAGETILVPVSGELCDMRKIFILNSSAEYIWANLDGKNSLNDILTSLCSAFDVSQQEAGADIKDLIANLSSAGLIEG